MYAFIKQVRSRWSASRAAFTTVVNIGIGESDLGPSRLSVEAYTGRAHVPVRVERSQRHVRETAELDPETTLFIVASKTFTTLET